MNKQRILNFAFQLLFLVTALPVLALDSSGKDPDKIDPNGPLMFTGEKTDMSKLNMNALTRLDFRVEGASCAICLGRIRKRIEKAKGIAKVSVAISKPYGVAVIYDNSKTKKEKIFEAGLKGETEKVRFLDDQEEKLEKMPFILIPKCNSLMKS